MKKVMLTGSRGFIGQHLLPELLKKGYEVHELRHLVMEGSPQAKHQKGSTTVHRADITDHEKVKKLVREVSPDYVIHLAGASSVAKSYEDYNGTMEVNYSATVNFAEACRKQENLKQFIFAGSSEEYGAALKNARQKITEETPLNPTSPYAVSKADADMYLRHMGTAYGFPFTTMRAFNTYGRRHTDAFFIEKAITHMLSDKNGILELGDPKLIRDWLFVDDHVSGYMKALDNGRAIGETIQLCTGKGHTIKETAEAVSELTGFRGRIKWNAVPKRPNEAEIIIGDNSKAKKLLGWEPKYDLRDGLEKTISFWRSKL